ncbi:primase-helicase zinc-binding domain-containing protein [Paraburkholderia sp. J67]|uniref:primase-helicase zinc-binding domain-containing protein n=1 Tax=Paraburkholderia sp. J67 TaxID=2805435 RepID=UPI002ABE2B09|nr:primase-helicase zinc-binding domain-containing protein [Paraburkholderia sp. J67]
MKATSCPVCRGDDRFTYDNRNGRGDWVCRKCNDGDPMAGDGLQLIARVNRIGLFKRMRNSRAARLLQRAGLPTLRLPGRSERPARLSLRSALRACGVPHGHRRSATSRCVICRSACRA